ncbi:MAG: hypothetical protein J6V25_01735 [Oscillospiraceae bacterium]|nr:hypothetical protein [Oscillospiraceae bacterium]
MPNRIIKDSIRTSKSINTMTDFQFRLWAYLLTYVDDYGRGSADPELLKGFVFPRRKGVTEATIEKELQNLATIGSILLYDVDGESYLCFPKWKDHQRIQTKVSRFPAPEDGEIKNLTVSHGKSPSESNPIQSESKSEYKSKSESKPARAQEDSFEKFWSMYPRKEGKQKARSAFQKIEVPLEVILTALEQHKKSAQWTKNNGEFIPHASTWLNGKRWEDQMASNYDNVPKGASGVLGSAELEFIRRTMGSDMSPLPWKEDN